MTDLATRSSPRPFCILEFSAMTGSAEASDASPEIEFWFEFGSNYSYLSVMRIEEEARLHGVRIAWKPFLLGRYSEPLARQTRLLCCKRRKGITYGETWYASAPSMGLNGFNPARFRASEWFRSGSSLSGPTNPGSAVFPKRSWS